MEQDQKVIELINEFANSSPSQFFCHETTKDATSARAMSHLLYCFIDQLRNPISIEAESLTKWIIYKQSAVHRHQKFFGMFRTVNKFVKRFNDMELVRRLNGVYKRSMNSGNDYYLLKTEALRYIGTAYLRRLFVLDEIQQYCVKTANSAMGMLELNHWTGLALVIVALCAELNGETVKQVQEMEKAYKFGAKILRSVDGRFPNNLDEMVVVRRIKESSCAFDVKNADLSRITKLLKFTDAKISGAQTENEIDILKTKIMNELQNPKTPGPSKNVPKMSTDFDYGITISRNDISAFKPNTTADESTLEESLLSPFLFGKKKKEEITIKKKAKTKKFDSSFLTSTMQLLNDEIGEKVEREDFEDCALTGSTKTIEDQSNSAASDLAFSEPRVSKKINKKKLKRKSGAFDTTVASSISSFKISKPDKLKKKKKRKN